ncbi:Methuselah N-terminus [Popillia japonica]|uniref:Methuselah N-terminus n=1 Tax=Popillia japonica TaxID=7064 RepID=A0AAW1LYE3_POPJA
MGYISKSFRIYILCSVLTVGICTELVCEGFSYDNIDVFNNNVLSIGESEEQIRNCLCNPETCVYKCCPMGEEIHNLTCQASTTTRISGLKEYIESHLMLSRHNIIHQKISCFDAGMTRFIIKAKSNERPQQFIITPDISGLEYELEYFCVDYFQEIDGFGGLICIDDQLDITGSNIIGKTN